MEEQVRQKDGRHDACEICQQPARERVARILYIYATKIYSQDIECRIRRTLQDTYQPSYK